MSKRIKLYARTNMNGSDVEDYMDLPDDWDELSEEEQQAILDDAAQTHLQNCVDYGAYVDER
jgi:hypothetical protein